MDVFPLSFEQFGILFQEGLHADNKTYSIGGALSTPTYDPGRIESALRAVVRRHGALRSTFDIADQTQQVHSEPVFEFASHDLSDLSAEEDDAALRSLLHQLRETPSDRSVPARMNAIYVAHPTLGPVLTYSIDHLAADPVAIGIIEREIRSTFADDRSVEAPADHCAYGKYAIWQQERSLHDRWLEAEAMYWEKQFEHVPALPRLGRQSIDGQGETYDFEDAQWCPTDDRVNPLYALAARARSTPTQVILGATAGVIAVLTGCERVPLAIAVTTRTDPAFRSVVGVMFNDRLIPIVVRPEQTIAANIPGIGSAVFGAVRNSKIPLPHLAAALPHVADKLFADRPCLLEVAFAAVPRLHWIMWGPNIRNGFPARPSRGLRHRWRDPSPSLQGVDRLVVTVIASEGGLLIKTQLSGDDSAEGTVTQIADGVKALMMSEPSEERSVQQLLGAVGLS